MEDLQGYFPRMASQSVRFFTYSVAEELECPLCCKVEKSAAVTTQHHDQPRSERQTRLQDKIGAGGELRFGFSFLGSKSSADG